MWKKSNWYFWHFGSRATSSQPRTPRMGSKSWIYFRIVSKSLVFDWSANANRSDWLNAYWNVKKPSLDSLLVLVMFGVSPTCVTKMVVVPFLFLIYWCAFLVEFQELNFRFCPNLTPDKVDPKLTWPMIPFSKKCILTGSIMKLNLEQPQLLIWFSIQVNLSLETKPPIKGDSQ